MNANVVVRFIALVCYLILVLPLMWISTVLRLFHGTLRFIGVPNHLLPLDVIRYLASLYVRFGFGLTKCESF